MLVKRTKEKNKVRERDTNYERVVQFKIGWPRKAFLGRSQMSRFQKEVKKWAM